MAKDTIRVDVGAIAKELMLMIPTKEHETKIRRALGSATLAEWKRLAGMELGSTARDYSLALSIAHTKDKTTITLEDSEKPFIMLIEEGMTGGDMRKWMFNGPRVKHGKNGRYLIVPFRHGGAGTSGRNVGEAIPPALTSLVAKLKTKATRPHPEGYKRPGEAHQRTLKQSPSKDPPRLHANMAGIKADAKKILETKKQSWHTTSIYTGMMKPGKKYNKGDGSMRKTFRVISEGIIRGDTDEKGEATQHWYHPGITARHFKRRAEKNVMERAPTFVASVLKT